MTALFGEFAAETVSRVEGPIPSVESDDRRSVPRRCGPYPALQSGSPEPSRYRALGPEVLDPGGPGPPGWGPTFVAMSIWRFPVRRSGEPDRARGAMRRMLTGTDEPA